ncbi:hypothetical protein V8E53_004323, partial [Lactarius tabidus]
MTGYALAFCLLPAHFITHRLARTDPAPPISSLSPSELDNAKAALSGCPHPSAMLYSVSVLHDFHLLLMRNAHRGVIPKPAINMAFHAIVETLNKKIARTLSQSHKS